MNREILFKARTTKKHNEKHAFDNVWVEGDLIRSGGKYYIHPTGNKVNVDGELWKIIVMHEIDPTTLCQFTGLMDKNGQKIWENDIIEDDVNCYRVYWSKKYSNFSCEYVKTDEPIFKGRKWDLWSIIQEEEIYVKGNIFDNQELLEV